MGHFRTICLFDLHNGQQSNHYLRDNVRHQKQALFYVVNSRWEVADPGLHLILSRIFAIIVEELRLS